MSGLVKLIVIAAVVFGGFAIWKYGFSSEETTTSTEGNPLTVTDQDWSKGGTSDGATLIEYTDFQCPACGAYYPAIKQLMEESGDKLRIVIRHYPLMQIHPNALPAARAAEAAGRQGKFWEMHNLLFENQAEWSKAADPMKSIFPAYAGRIGIDADRFRQDMADSSLDDKINRDRASGNELEITGTPSFFLNGKKLENARSLEEFKQTVKDGMAQGK